MHTQQVVVTTADVVPDPLWYSPGTEPNKFDFDLPDEYRTISSIETSYDIDESDTCVDKKLQPQLALTTNCTFNEN